MKKLTENKRLESFAFCALIFVLALQPVLGRIGMGTDGRLYCRSIVRICASIVRICAACQDRRCCLYQQALL